MPTVALPPPAIVRSTEWASPELGDTPALQGKEGRQLLEIVFRAKQHWEERLERLVKLPGDEDLISYEPVIPRVAFVADVEYLDEGEGRPLPLEWDWED